MSIDTDYSSFESYAAVAGTVENSFPRENFVELLRTVKSGALPNIALQQQIVQTMLAALNNAPIRNTDYAARPRIETRTAIVKTYIPVPKKVEESFRHIPKTRISELLNAAKKADAKQIRTVRLDTLSSNPTVTPQQLGQEIAQAVLDAYSKSLNETTISELFCAVIESVTSGSVTSSDISAVEVAACTAIATVVITNPAEQAVVIAMIPEAVVVLNWIITICAGKIEAAIAALKVKIAPRTQFHNLAARMN